jgi:integrase
MASIFKKVKRKGSPWYVDYFDEHGVRRRVKGCADRAATELIARKLESDVELRRRGVIDPESEQQAAAARRPLSAHIRDFHAALMAKGNTPKHADLFVNRARRVIALVKGAGLAEIDPPRTASKADRGKAAKVTERLLESAHFSDLTEDAVQGALAALREGGKSLATCNHHRAAIRRFSRWAKKTRRTSRDDLAELGGYNAGEDRRHDRRTIGIEDLRRLVEAAERGPSYRRMTGTARALCYRLAVATGLRLSEIKSISAGSIDFEASPATVTVAAGYTKNRQAATLHLPDDVAADLRAWVARLAEDAPVFPLPDRGADMLKIDLAVAGIPYRDGAGLVFDFHSLRCQTATLADKSGCSPRTVQRLMRHSTLDLTDRYTRPRVVDLERAALALPELRPAPRSREARAATGTDGPAPGATASATADDSDDPNPSAGKSVASSDQRNHNPRVGGSSPSAATRDSRRHLPPKPAPPATCDDGLSGDRDPASCQGPSSPASECPPGLPDALPTPGPMIPTWHCSSTFGLPCPRPSGRASWRWSRPERGATNDPDPRSAGLPAAGVDRTLMLFEQHHGGICPTNVLAPTGKTSIRPRAAIRPIRSCEAEFGPARSR